MTVQYIYIYPFMEGVIGYIYSCLTNFSSLVFLTFHFYVSAFPVHTFSLFFLFLSTLIKHTFLRYSIYFLFLFILLGHFLLSPPTPSTVFNCFLLTTYVLVWEYSSIWVVFFFFSSKLFTLNFYLVSSPPYISSV